jgi:hypothetical protein
VQVVLFTSIGCLEILLMTTLATATALALAKSKLPSSQAHTDTDDDEEQPRLVSSGAMKALLSLLASPNSHQQNRRHFKITQSTRLLIIVCQADRLLLSM